MIKNIIKHYSIKTNKDAKTKIQNNPAKQYIYRQWNASDLAKQGIKNTDVASNEFFIIQYDIINEEVDVASTRGIKDEDGNSYYTLSSLRNK